MPERQGGYFRKRQVRQKMRQRLQKLIAASGLMSRRAAEALLSDGRVRVNGAPASLGESADPDLDEITVDGKALPKVEHMVYIMLNKPRGYVTTMSDDRGRKTVADLTGDVGTRVFPVGRLDYDSEGLLLLTNDGALAQKLEHPSGEVKKTYLVRVKGDADAALPVLRSPLELDGSRIRPAEVKLLKRTDVGALLSVTISEGRNRQIRRMCELAGLSVLRLRRVSEGNLLLGGLPVGRWRPLTDSEIENLQKGK